MKTAIWVEDPIEIAKERSILSLPATVTAVEVLCSVSEQREKYDADEKVGKPEVFCSILDGVNKYLGHPRYQDGRNNQQDD